MKSAGYVGAKSAGYVGAKSAEFGGAGKTRYTVCLIDCDPLVFEQIGASLRRGPFVFVQSSAPMPADQVDLYVAPAAAAPGFPRHGPPLIACGPAALMRTSFLAGCEDYLRDPWTPEELSLRALAVLARGQRRYRFPWGEISFEGNDLRTPAGLVALTLNESRILRMLLRARGAPVPRAALAWSTGKARGAAEGRRIDVHVSAVRRKLNATMPSAGRFIVSVRGQGYMVP
jgi:hypothetical protein